MKIQAITAVHLHETTSFHLSIMETEEKILIIPIDKDSFARIHAKFKHRIIEVKEAPIEGGGKEGKMKKYFFNNIEL